MTIAYIRMNGPRTVFAAILMCSLGPVPALAQNRPPVPAPVKTITVSSLPVVRSQSEIIEDLSTNLIPGLIAGEKMAQGLELIAVRDNYVVVRKHFGSADPDAPFDAGSLSHLLLSVAAMQEIEAGTLMPETDIPSGASIPQLLTHQVENASELLAQAVEDTSGETSSAYVAAHIFTPLMMSQSKFADGAFLTTMADMGQLMMALVNGGATSEGRILKADTIAAMERTQFAFHPNLPGWTYGLAEMWRNGWRALQHDGVAAGVQARLVLVPKARFGYFIVLKGRGGARFWRTLDDALFDRIFAREGEPEPPLHGAVEGDPTLAASISGTYQPSDDPVADVAPLKVLGQRLKVEARADGALILSGAENAVLTMQGENVWAADGGNLNATLNKARLVLSSGMYERLQPWQLWYVYFWLGLALAFIAAVTFDFEQRRKRIRAPGNMVLAATGTSVALLFTSVLMWLLAPVV